MATLDDVIVEAEKAVGEFSLASVTLSECVDRLVALQKERPAQKTEAMVALMQVTNPATGKWYTASQAEDVLQLVPEYADFKARVAEAEAAVREASDEKRSAELIAELRVNVARHPVEVA